MSENRLLLLYQAHQRALIAYAGRILGSSERAEDVTQEAYLRLSAASSTAVQHENPEGYLYRIVRNLALDYRRRHQLEKSLFSHSLNEVVQEQPEERPSLEEQAITRSELERLQLAMDELPERTRLALEMHRLGGYKLREIAEHLGISTSMAQHLVVEGVKHCQRRCARQDA
ncbi:RNA polymerase sigma factor [Halopseudomonas pachastrellae]|uniref:RNA polymerase sigma factor n=1 Tax=Halopseudomonas pachastrellae TaxID=254161 RepID=UPI003D7C3B49